MWEGSEDNQRSSLLLPTKAQSVTDTSQTHTSEQLVDAQATQDTVHETSETQAVQQFAN